VPNDCPQNFANPIDSIPAILSRATDKQADSVFNWGLANNFREMSFVIVQKNGMIYAKNFISGSFDGSKTRVNYLLAVGEQLLGYFHSHPIEADPKGRSFFSFNDIQEARKNANITNYCAIVECGNKRYAMIIEDAVKLNNFLFLSRLDELKRGKLE
jgi:hypothetical protein